MSSVTLPTFVPLTVRLEMVGEEVGEVSWPVLEKAKSPPRSASRSRRGRGVGLVIGAPGVGDYRGAGGGCSCFCPAHLDVHLVAEGVIGGDRAA